MDFKAVDAQNTHGEQSGGLAGPDLRKGPGPGLMGADTLIGNDVYNHKSESIGNIKEIMLDMADGRVGYAVLSFGAFFGFGEKLFAVPWKALTLDTKNRRFLLNVEKNRLADAPGFNKDMWPDMADQTWAKEVHAFYSTRHYLDDEHRA